MWGKSNWFIILVAISKKTLVSDVIQDDVQSNEGVMVLLAQPKIRVFIIPFHKKTKERMVTPLSFNIIYIYFIYI